MLKKLYDYNDYLGGTEKENDLNKTHITDTQDDEIYETLQSKIQTNNSNKLKEDNIKSKNSIELTKLEK